MVNYNNIKDARKLLRSFIKELPNKKLIIIIDELDRCRPDYAMKVLETTKHFFDIEGIFFILPTNMPALDNAIKALYGIENNRTEQECYFKKFFNDERKIPKPNYKTIVTKYINENTLRIAINKEYITTSNNNSYYSLEKLQASIELYGKMAKLTLRQMTDMLRETVRIINILNEKIQCEYLAYLMCKSISIEQNVTLNNTHPFSHGMTNKKEILNFRSVGEKIRVNCVSGLSYCPNSQSLREIFSKLFESIQYTNSPFHQQFTSYPEAHSFITEKISLITELKEHSDYINKNLYSIIIQMENILKEKEIEIQTYKNINGSNENDEITKKRYDGIIEKRETLYN